MDDGVKMNLRAHRQRNYTVTESQHPEEFGYARSNYSKEYVSPAFELNSAAKLMTKFINSVNKRSQLFIVEVREKIKIDELSEKAATHQNQMVANKNQDMQVISNNGPRKITGSRKDPKEENSKIKQKKPVSAQGNSKDPKSQDPNDKNKGIRTNIHAPSLTLNPSDHNLYRVLAQLGTSGRGMNPALSMEAVTKAILQQQSYVNNTQFFKDKQKGQPQQIPPRGASVKYKLFRRSSYHVAIAYNIHLKKIYENGGQINQAMLDPTHPAKKLRIQQEKQMKE